MIKLPKLEVKYMGQDMGFSLLPIMHWMLGDENIKNTSYYCWFSTKARESLFGGVTNSIYSHSTSNLGPEVDWMTRIRS